MTGSAWRKTSRRKVELGVISITSLVPDNAAAGDELAFDAIRLTDGIELSDRSIPGFAFPLSMRFPRRRAEVTAGHADARPGAHRGICVVE